MTRFFGLSWEASAELLNAPMTGFLVFGAIRAKPIDFNFDNAIQILALLFVRNEMSDLCHGRSVNGRMKSKIRDWSKDFYEIVSIPQ
jgi:hypothetical protein